MSTKGVFKKYEDCCQGKNQYFVAFFHARVDKRKKLILGQQGSFPLIADTGFSGGVALPLKILEKMDVQLAFYDTFRLATGKIVELPVFSGYVVVRKHEIETWFIPGDSLLGMEFLSLLGSFLSLDFKKRVVKLMK